jgi:POTRA domain-containing FtsQ-type protein/cell division protein FtsQ
MTSIRLPLRRPVAGRRVRRTRRTASWISRTRLAAALGLVLVGGAFVWMTSARAFEVDPTAVTIEGVAYTDPATIRSDLHLDAPGAANVFRVPAAELERAIASLPTVLSVRVVASLPNHLRVLVHDRTPIFAWRQAGAAWLVDETGDLFEPAPDPPADATGRPLPLIVDLRSADPAPSAGHVLDPGDLAVARLLGALTPDLVGSTAPALQVSIDDHDGWVVQVPSGWQAVFGRYAPDVHTVDDIPRQVQCLRSLLLDREASVGVVRLPLGADRCGTFTLASPAAGGPQSSSRPGSPTRSPGPTARPGKPDRTPPPGRPRVTPTPRPGRSPRP